MSLSTKPSARSALMPTSLTELRGAPSPERGSPASITVLFALGPEPSIWKLQRMHGPRFGIPCGSARPVGLDSGSLPGPSARPITATSAWAFGQLNWYGYETAPEPFSDVVRYFSHSGGNDGTLRDVGSV